MKRKDKKISSNKCDLDNREYDNNLHALRKELKQFDLVLDFHEVVCLRI